MAGVHASARLPEPVSGKANTGANLQQSQNAIRSPPRDARLRMEHKKQKLSHSPEDAEAVNAPVVQIKSQESGSDQSASHWFDKVNQHVTATTRDNTDYDDEPPFFMTHQHDYRPNTLDPSEGSRLFGVQSRLDSENEELRGVIDDLTVENKRLKQVLRINKRSQRNSPSIDSQDKLFEVRMHGLSSEKRRELEFLLKNFATSVHTSVAPSIPNSTAGSGASSNSLAPNTNAKSKADSGYASNSNSGHQSVLHAPHIRPIPTVSHSTKHNSVKNYLHEIPDTLLPRQHPIVMSERARMALVVRRLEQLFTGRNAAPGEHSQPLQQQEVSHMAAKADATANKKKKTEGSREAHILPPESKVNFDAVETGSEKKRRIDTDTSDGGMSNYDGAVFNISRPGSPDQRPTRPLDLDIHRAQVAAENIQYIRHLGLSSPHLDSEDSHHPWMYLNLLVNMAQIHTINVTPEFVRKSIKKLSTKFELSKDGYRVRWIGGRDGTVFSKEEEKALEVVDSHKGHNSPDESNEDGGTGSSSKRSKTDSNSNAVTSNMTTSEDKTSGLQTSNTSKQQISAGQPSNNLSSHRSRPTQVSSAFDYKPIVYRERSHDFPEESYLQDSDSSLGGTSRDSSGLAHALSQSNLSQQRRSDEGVITFYNTPFFCSDYSGDKMPSNMLAPRDALPGTLLGVNPGDIWGRQTSRLADACYFTPNYGPLPFRPLSDENLPTLKLEPLSTAPADEIQPIELAVSGLGGVVPEDNFAIDTQVHMIRISAMSKAITIGRVPLTGTEIKSRYKYKPGACDKVTLLPSRLPPASYVFFTSSSSSGNQIDDESSIDSDETSSSEDDNYPAPPTFLQRWSSANPGGIGIDDNEIDDDDGSSMDMLAAARAADPERIAEQERQYVINQPGGRAVAGSLAATVGASRTASSIGDDNVDVKSDKAAILSDEDGDSGMDIDDDDRDDY